MMEFQSNTTSVCVTLWQSCLLWFSSPLLTTPCTTCSLPPSSPTTWPASANYSPVYLYQPPSVLSCQSELSFLVSVLCSECYCWLYCVWPGSSLLAYCLASSRLRLPVIDLCACLYSLIPSCCCFFCLKCESFELTHVAFESWIESLSFGNHKEWKWIVWV